MFRHESSPPTQAEPRVTLVTSGCPGAGVRTIDTKEATPMPRAIDRCLTGLRRVLSPVAPGEYDSRGETQ